tara:strand:+ start:333 stop:566 length:234 start_codon:yes stop_codon:yes gene_type:complete
MKVDSKCKTPGAKYHIDISLHTVSCKVEIPFDLELSEDDTVRLEQQIHAAIEGVLYPKWPKVYKNQWEGWDQLPPGF